MAAVDATDVTNQFVDAFKQKSVVEDSKKRYVVDGVEFGIMSGKEITSYSLMEVHNRELYNPSTREPYVFGCLDRRLGISHKNGGQCKTCNQSVENCTGHFGFVRLCLPVFHCGYFKHTIALLTCICKECSHVLFDSEERERYLKRMRAIRHDPLARKLLFRKMVTEARSLTSCPKCAAVNGPVRKFVGQPLKVYHEVNPKKLQNSMTSEDAMGDQYRLFINRPDDGNSDVIFRGKLQEELSPLRVKRLLENIPQEDWEILDVVDPESLLITHAIVPPVCIRPSVMMGDAGSTEDDITVRVAEIVNCNALLRGLIVKGASVKQIWENWEFLALQCALLVNGDLPGLPQGILTKPVKGISQRLKGKEGRFRGNLSGKRVDFSGRTVISPDPNLAVDEVAVPQWMAKRLTFPERVCDINIARLRKAVLRGADEYPGAQFITKVDGQKSMLRYGNRRQLAAELKVGDLVERHLIDGDIVLFNRQPSLHRMSIMAHRARVLPWRTLRFNECCCQPYNADFDGDEMNIHVPQTLEARAEALNLMGIVHNLVTPKNGEPLIHCTQDFLTGSYLLNQKETFLNRSEAALVAAYFSDGLVRIRLPPPCIVKPVELWSGKQLFSLLLRPNEEAACCINIEVKEREFSGANPAFMCPVDGFVLIRNSELIAGAPGKATLGGAKNGLIFHLIRDNGAHVAAQMMSRIAKCTSRWLMHRGMTIGMDDVTPNPKLVVEKASLLGKGYDKVEETIQSYKEGRLKTRPGCTPEQTLEAEVKGTLDELRDTAGKACKSQLRRSNKPLMMFLCGSKGQLINTAQMVACVGQQNVGGQRIKNGFVARTLPHFLPNSRDAASRGFVANSFFTGLTPYEFFFHTMSGREGLVDTAVKTADTGYMQRRLMKALEDLSTYYDRSVRTSGGQVVQFVYGDDGLNPHLMEGKSKPLEFPHVWLQINSLVAAERRAAVSEDRLRLRKHRSTRADETMERAVAEMGARPLSPSSFVPLLASWTDLNPLLAGNVRKVTDAQLLKTASELSDAARAPILPTPLARMDRLRALVGRVVYEKGTPQYADILKDLPAELAPVLMEVSSNLPELAVARIRSLQATGELHAFAKACIDVDRDAFKARANTWEALAAQLEAELMVASIPESLRDEPLLPSEVRAWMSAFNSRVPEGLPKSLQSHVALSTQEHSTHQALTKEMITFQRDIDAFLEEKLLTNVEKVLSKCNVDPQSLAKPSELANYLRSLPLKSQTHFPATGPQGSSTAPTDETARSEDGDTSIEEKSPTSPGETVAGWEEISRSLKHNEVSVSARGLLEFLKMAWKKYIKALVQPGEAVGAVGGQSIGEPGTQMTLKTFHFAGVASMNVTLGVPRIKEIINAAKNITTPIMHVVLQSKHSVHAARLVKSRIERTSLSDIVASLKEVFTPTGENRMHVSIKLDIQAIQSLGHLDLTTEEVAQKISQHPPLVKLKLKPEHVVVQNDRKILVIPPNAGDRNSALFLLRTVKGLLPGVCVRGVTTARRGVVNIHDEKADEKPWYDVFVEGYGLREVMAVEGVVGTKTTTNHTDEIFRVLGIEAARVSIIREIKGCMDAYSMDIDIRHMMLLGDIMTNRGEVLGINRFGISKMRGSTLLLASFEETNEHLFEAAAHRRQDPVDGVSECIILGKPVRLGTGAFNLIQDLTASQPEDKRIPAAAVTNVSVPASVLASSAGAVLAGKFGFPTRAKGASLIAKYRTIQQNNDVEMV